MRTFIKNTIIILKNIDFNSDNKIKHLGRWSYINSNHELNNKIERANIDHCGPCGNDREILKLHHNKKI